MENIIDLIFPPICVVCKQKIGKTLCKRCADETYMLHSTKCIICDKESLLGQTHTKCSTQYTPAAVYSIFKYSGHVRQIIKNAKYNQKTFAPLRKLTQYGLQESINNGFHISGRPTLIPIPLNKAKLKDRGFNQAEIIAKVVAKNLRLNLDTRALRRVRKTKVQYSNSRKERFENVSGAFQVRNNADVQNKSIILIDDICTSGATLIEATKTLLQANAHTVDCITLAKAELDRLDNHKKMLKSQYV